MGTTSTELTPVSAEDLGANSGTKNDNMLMSGRSAMALPPEMAGALEMERMLGQITAALASQTWGQRMTPVLRRATAQYCLAYGIDPLTELDLLGGIPYVNSEFYLRKLGEMRVAGIIRDYWFDNITNDPELLAIAGSEDAPTKRREWAREEHWRRWQRRRELGAKEEAEAVCAMHIQLAGGGHDIVGWKQGGGGTSIKQHRSGGEARPNPVVEDDNNVALAVESQAARRAVRQIKSHVGAPGLMELAHYFAGVDDDGKALGARIRAARPPRPHPASFQDSGQNVALAGDAYGYDETRDAARVDVAPKALPEPAPNVVSADPYTEEPVRTKRWRGKATNVDMFPD
ncbi:MAG TPA: hypothetical protein VH439_17320 [Gemmatimonadales bacterium]|jgi:hypothetical protein